MTVSGSWRAVVALGTVICVVGGGAVSCFSDRVATAPVEGVCTLPIDAGVPGSTVIVVRQFAFAPADVRLRAGDRVTWVNCETEALAHTTTADAGEWSSPLLSSGNGFTHTFTTPGEFPYHCEPHPFMTGRIVVE